MSYPTDCWWCLHGRPAPLPDARPLRLIRRFVTRPRDHARTKPQPCRCELAPHAFCHVVTCKCDHGIGAS